MSVHCGLWLAFDAWLQEPALQLQPSMAARDKEHEPKARQLSKLWKAGRPARKREDGAPAWWWWRRVVDDDQQRRWLAFE